VSNLTAVALTRSRLMCSRPSCSGDSSTVTISLPIVSYSREDLHEYEHEFVPVGLKEREQDKAPLHMRISSEIPADVG
jgi:hypothetical protein